MVKTRTEGEMRELVACRVGTYVTSDPAKIQQMLKNQPHRVEFVYRDQAHAMARIFKDQQIGKRYEELALSPTLVLVDEEDNVHESTI